MFDTLTEDERFALNLKLHGWAHEFYVVAHTLAKVSLTYGSTDDPAWDHRDRYTAARADLVDLIHTELAA